jgi:hypothetical protein
MNRFLMAVSLAVCSLSVNTKALATTTKQAICYAVSGFCTVNCDPGMVVVGGGCFMSLNSIGTSANFPSGTNQWACRPTARATYINVYAICQ